MPALEPTPAKEPGRAGNLTVIRATGDSKLPRDFPIPLSWKGYRTGEM